MIAGMTGLAPWAARFSIRSEKLVELMKAGDSRWKKSLRRLFEVCDNMAAPSIAKYVKENTPNKYHSAIDTVLGSKGTISH